MINVLLLCGGDGAEHSISLVSADFAEQMLRKNEDLNVLRATVHDHGFVCADGSRGSFADGGVFVHGGQEFKVDCVVPVIHGIPGETGDIQSFLSILGIPFIGCGSEASRNCFNKITAKLYFTALGIPNTPYVMIPRDDEAGSRAALEFFDRYGDVYVKAASQGSSVGCYHVKDRGELAKRVHEAFGYSSEVIVEKNIKHRELEVAAYEMDGKLTVTTPGEIIMPDNVFYTYEEKYSKDSGTVTTVEPKGLSESVVREIQDYARRAFTGMKLRDLSRIDFFLSEEDGVLLNEINTFPGMTPISMFPKLLEHQGGNMKDFLGSCVRRAVKEGRKD
jgi:D-alanine-D-alanine ligase